MTDYTPADFEELYELLQDEYEDEYTNFSNFDDDFDIYFSGTSGDAKVWVNDELSNRDIVEKLYLPDVVDTADTVVNDVVIGLGGAAAYDLSKLLSTKNLATIVDDFGTAATASVPSLTTQAQTALSDFARFAAKYALPLAIAGVGTKSALQAIDDDWESVAHDVAAFSIGLTSAKIGQSMMAGYAAALADGFVGPASGSSLAFYGSKLVQAGGGMLLAGSAVYAFSQAWELAKELHEGTIVSDYAWFLGKVGEYAEDFIDDAFDGNADPGDIGDALAPFMGMWGDAIPPLELPGWMDDALTPFEDAKTTSSPLTVDLDSDGIELTAFNAATTATFFDIDGDSFAEQTAWVSADDGLLVRDLDESGTIDDVTELFGSPTIDGFALLSEMDTNGDLVIDASDTDWDDLRIWQDANGDAVTQDGELLTLASLDIVSIDLAGVAASTSIINGNPISHTSTFKYDNGSTDAIVDAWFVHDNVNTKYIGTYTLDEDALFLPTLRGFGKLPDLHVAMSSDATLLGLVEDFAVGWGFDRFADASALDGDVADIAFEWAGVESVSPTSRGLNVDAQHLEFLEEYFGTEFFQGGSDQTPAVIAGEMLEQSWGRVFGHLAAQLMVQSGASALFEGTISVNASSGDFEGDMDLSEDAINDLVAYATDTGVDTEAYWIKVADFLHYSKGLSNITSTEEGWLDTAIYDSGLTTQTWEDIVELYDPDTTGSNIYGDSSNETLNGTTLDDTLLGRGGNDVIYGGDGDDLINSGPSSETAADELYGGNGNDTILGMGGNDLLSPGAGGDRAEGKDGDDTYVYTSGDDVYAETDGDDKILLPGGIDLADLSFHRLGNYDLLIAVGTLGSIQIESQFNTASWVTIEEIEFDDQSTLNLLTIDAPATYGTDGNDNLDGIVTGAQGSNVIYGLGGDDDIDTKGGANNTVDGGSGNDYIEARGDDDVIIASAGFDTVAVALGKTASIEIPEPYSDGDVTAVRLASDPNNLYIFIDGLGQIAGYHQYASSVGRLSEITFADASPSINLLTMQVETRGTEGNDNFSGTNYGSSENDILNPLGGDDIVNGGHGDDTYIYTSGHDTYAETSSGTDILEVAPDWTLEDLDFRRYTNLSNRYVVEIDGSNSITLNVQNGMWETLRMNDGSGDIAFANIVVEAHGTESNNTIYGDLSGVSMDDVMYGHDGSDNLNGYTGNDLLYGGDGDDTLKGMNGNDVLDGGAGDDDLQGMSGDDTYLYSGGLDEITDTDGTDILWIMGGATINDITISDYSTYDANLVVNTATDEVLLEYLRYGNQNYHLEAIKFDDGFETDQLPDYSNWSWGTASGETLTGTGSANVLIAKDGADTIDAGAGDDDAHGGAGADTLNGEDGDDLLHGGDDVDALNGGADNDALYGGDGGDTLHGDAGDDILFGQDGLDTLYGDGGADTFMFLYDFAFNDVDVVKDFDIGTDNDVLDLSDILANTDYEDGIDPIANFIEITTNGSDSDIKVDITGAGTFGGGTQIATLEGITGLTDEAALVSSGNLIVI